MTQRRHRTTGFTTFKGLELGAGDVVRFGFGAAHWQIGFFEVRRTGVVAVCYGPVGSPAAQFGKCFWLGEKTLIVQAAQGQGKRKRLTLEPVKSVKVVERYPAPKAKAEIEQATAATKAAAR